MSFEYNYMYKLFFFNYIELKDLKDHATLLDRCVELLVILKKGPSLGNVCMFKLRLCDREMMILHLIDLLSSIIHYLTSNWPL